MSLLSIFAISNTRKSTLAHRRIQIFATRLDVENLGASVRVGLFQFSLRTHMLLEVVRVRDLLEIAAQYHRWFVVFGDRDRIETAFTAATNTYRPMKFMKFVPCNSNCAIHALLSFSRDTWQSVHPLVSLPRTVCGTKVEKACPLKPSAEIVCCW